jgi:hypothetical protein
MSLPKHLTPILTAIAIAAVVAPTGAAASVAEPPISGASVTAITAQPDPTPLGALRGAGGVNEAATVASPSTSSESSGEGFSWADATIGAAGMLALLGVGGGIVLLSRRSGRQPARAG